MKTQQQATVHDIARIMGVSAATVSRALNNKPGVGPDLRQRILAKIDKMGFTPSAAARNLSSARSHTLGVVCQDISAGWFLEIYRGILNRGACTNYHLLTAVSEREGDEYDVPYRLLSGQKVDGLIWLDPRTTPQVVNKITKLGVPLVLLQFESDNPKLNTLSIDNTQGAALAMRHLLGTGYRRILLITGGEDDVASRQKTAGVALALKEARAKIPANLILNGRHNADFAAEAISPFIARGRPLPEAIFCYNDEMALAVLHRLQKKGIRVPEDVAIMGFDGIAESRRAMLSTIETPMREMGSMATQALIDLVEHEGPAVRPARQILFRGSLCIRETCGATLRKGIAPTAE